MLRHNYGWIFFIQVTSYIGKLLIHPTPIGSLKEFFARATIGPVSEQLVLLARLVFHATWVTLAMMTYRSRRGADRARPPRPARDALLELARGGRPIGPPVGSACSRRPPPSPRDAPTLICAQFWRIREAEETLASTHHSPRREGT